MKVKIFSCGDWDGKNLKAMEDRINNFFQENEKGIKVIDKHYQTITGRSSDGVLTVIHTFVLYYRKYKNI